MKFSKLINKTCEEFIEWADNKISKIFQYDKKQLYDNFLTTYPEYLGRLKQRDFTSWLRFWGDYKNLDVLETHSDDIRYISYIERVDSSNLIFARDRLIYLA